MDLQMLGKVKINPAMSRHRVEFKHLYNRVDEFWDMDLYDFGLDFKTVRYLKQFGITTILDVMLSNVSNYEPIYLEDVINTFSMYHIDILKVPSLLDDIDTTTIDKRSAKRLLKAGIKTLLDLNMKSDKDLLALNGVGPSTVNDIHVTFDNLGYIASSK